jgi:hypothetical protein
MPQDHISLDLMLQVQAREALADDGSKVVGVPARQTCLSSFPHATTVYHFCLLDAPCPGDVQFRHSQQACDPTHTAHIRTSFSIN